MSKSKTKVLNLINIIVWVLAIVSVIILSITTEDKKLSTSEKRNLAQLPELTTESVLKTKYMDNLEDYLLDQFPYRDTLRELKTSFEISVYGMSDSDGYTKDKNHIHKVDYDLHEDKIEKIMTKINTKADTIKEANPEANIYYSIIPDKSYYNKDVKTFNHDKMLKIVKQAESNNITYINIFDTLSEKNYYYTDLHWRQESIVDTANTLLNTFGKSTISKEEYETENITNEFNGSYASAASFKTQLDTITIMTNENLENIKVFDYETNKYISIYNRDKAKGLDPYEAFLDGSKSLLRIENPDSTSDERLLIFRDSFSSSLAPLLVNEYKEIVLVDLRYITYDFANKLVDFNSFNDIIFIYNTFVLNESDTFKI